MAYGKYRDGITSVGRQAANWAQDDDKFSFSTRRRGNVTVRKSGEFTNIHQQPVLQDAFYVLGDLTGAGTHVLASPNARQPFRDRGLAPDNGGFVLSELGFYGRGWGSVLRNGTSDVYTDFDGDPVTVFSNALARTRNGRVLEDLYSFFPAVPQEASGTLSFIIRGGYRYVGTTATFFTGLCFTGLDGDQYAQAFVHDDGTNRTLGGTEFLFNQIGWYATPCVLAPGVILKMDRYLRPTDVVTVIDPLACPGLRFNYTTDGGIGWASATDSMFATELATITGLDIAQPGLFNAAIAEANLRTAPLSRTLSVAIGHVPYIETTAGPTYTVKVRVKMGLINTGAGCALSASTTLFDGLPIEAARFLSRDLLAIPDGVLVFTRDDAAGAEWNAPARVRFTNNGAGFDDRGYMPLPEYCTGVPTGIDTKTLICPMFDGAYNLYQSKDWGATWTLRTNITENGVAPVTGLVVMGNFSIVTMLRRENQPANAAPATPWLYDCRVDAP